MKLQEYIDRKFKHGTIHKIHYIRPVKTLKAFADHKLEKETIGVYRIGCSYSNLAVNKDRETGSLPYGKWEYSNEIIRSVTKAGVESYQLRLTAAHNSRIENKVTYYLDGVITPLQTLIDMGVIGASEATPDQREVFNVKLENIVEIK